MVNWQDFDNRQKQIAEEQQTMFDVRKSLFDFPAGDTTELLQKPMNPVETFDQIITRDDTTGNILNAKDARDVEVLLTSAVALNESRKLFLDIGKTKEEIAKMTPEELLDHKDTMLADKWLAATVQLVKASAKARSAVSKSYKGWLGELFITLKRKGEISAEFIRPGKSSTLK